MTEEKQSNKLKFVLWLGRFVHDSTSDQPSVKRFGLAITVTVLCGVLFGLGVVIAVSVLNAIGREQVDMVRIAAGYVMGQRSKAGDVCCRMRERPPRVNVCLLARMLYEKKT